MLPAADGHLSTTSYGYGPTVAWIHGYTMDSRMFAEVWPEMPGFRHLGIDLPGHGGSPPLRADTAMADLAADVAAVLRREDATAVVALSMGTMVAFEVAIRRLHPIDRLAVIAPALVGMPPADGTAERYRTLARMRRAGASPADLVAEWMTSPPGIFAGISRHPTAFRALRDVVSAHSWAELDFGGPAAFYRCPQRLADLPGSAARLLVIAGGQDMPEFRELARGLRTAVPAVEVFELPGAGHLPLLEDPAGCLPTLRAFLRPDG